MCSVMVPRVKVEENTGAGNATNTAAPTASSASRVSAFLNLIGIAT